MTFENRYSFLDKALHRLSFSTRSVQIEVAEFENWVFKKELAGIDVHNPVFITSLPRAGTTLLLNILVKHAAFGAHCYRDMPFVMTPLFWNRFSRHFYKSACPRERAHGDGMLVGFDTPEAFEEIIWKSFWPDKYQPDHILPWVDENNQDFWNFFEHHIKKILWLRIDRDKFRARYISKNNLNIARIRHLRQRFADAIIIVPFRQPLQHAASLLKQHLNFLKIHKRDLFARKYMKAIGHFDFGANLRPVNFSRWLNSVTSRDPTKLTFWLEYWVATYQYLLDHLSHEIHFLSYDAFCSDSKNGLLNLLEILDIADDFKLFDESAVIGLRRLHPIVEGEIDARLLSEAEDLWLQLSEKSLI